MSMASQTQSRERILTIFQEISGLNVEDCIQFLNQYNWKLEDILEAFYNKKDFKKNSSISPNIKNEFQQTSSQNPNLGTFYANNDRNHQAIEDDDRYIAYLIQHYGDADESARKNRKENSQYHPPQPQTSQEKHTTIEPIYHEKQQLLRCGIHSLNNLFQIPNLFTHQHLDSIVREFDKRYINNDYGTLWIGDYDLRILIEAINRFGFIVRQINFYHDELLENYPWDSYFGLLININGAHWFTIKNLNHIYYNLDSTFSKPLKIGQKNDLIKYLIHFIQKFNQIYIFTVLQQQQQQH